MKKLLSEGSRNDEVEHIREDVAHRFVTLRKRLASWKTSTIVLGGGATLSIIGGLVMLFLGQLPESIDLVSPVVQAGSSVVASPGGANSEFVEIYDTLKGVVEGGAGRVIAITMILMGILQGFVRQNLASLVMGVAGGIGLYLAPTVMDIVLGVTEVQMEPAPFAAIQTQFGEAVDSGDWARAWQLLEPISASESDVAMLRSQVAYQAGEEQESLRIIGTRELVITYPEKVWMIESRFAQEHVDAHYQMTDGALQYAGEQADLRAQGRSLLGTAALLGILTLTAGLVTLTLRRNVKAINAWVSPTQPEGNWTPAIDGKGT